MSNMPKTGYFTVPAIIAFPSLFTKTAAKGTNSPPKYNTALIITGETFETIVKPQFDWLVAQAFSNDESQQFGFRPGFLPCSQKAKTYPAELTQGMYYGNAKSDYQPDVIDQARQPIIEPNLIRDGAKIWANINLWAFANSGNIGVSLGLNMIMFGEEGPALNASGGMSVDEAFAGIAVSTSVQPSSAPPSSTAPTSSTPPPPPR